MAVPSLRRRAGMTEIENKERKLRETIKKDEPKEVSKEEHDKRVNLLKDLGLLKK